MRVGFVGLATKPTGGRFVGLGLKADQKTRRDSGSVGSPGRPDRIVRGASRSFYPEDTGVTEELASEGSKAWWMRVPAGKDIRVIFQICPYGVCISRGSLVISIPPPGL